MEIPLSIAVGVLAGGGLFLLLQRSVIKMVIGLLLMSHAANLTIFIVGRLTKGGAPIIDERAGFQDFADPLVQALILTAIVIGFGVAAFLITLAFRTHKEIGSDDVNDMRNLKG